MATDEWMTQIKSVHNWGIIPLSSSQIKSGRYSVLGRGLWSEVLDVGDGTALKLTRRRCAGIGDGLAKIQREVRVLQAVRAKGYQSGLAIAEVCGWGERLDCDPRKDDFSLWLQTMIVPGRVRTVAELEKLSELEVQLVGASIACAIANIHNALRPVEPNLRIPTATENLQMIADEICEDREGTRYATRILKILNRLGSEPSYLIHGDCNISNFLFKGDAVCSVVDFAETRKGFYEEDLAAIVAELPSYRTVLIQSFEKMKGCSVIESRLNYGLAMKAFLSFVISRRLGNWAESDAAQYRLNRILKEI